MNLPPIRRLLALSILAVALFGSARADDEQATAERLIRELKMQPIPQEGGYFVQSYKSSDVLPAKALPRRYKTPHAAGTAIYALLTPTGFSAMHRLLTDEVWHFYGGAPVELLLLHPDGRGETVRLGADLLAGERPQLVVPRGSWLGGRPADGRPYSLVGTTMSPGFEPEDYEHGDRAALVARYPQHAAAIDRLTRP